MSENNKILLTGWLRSCDFPVPSVDQSLSVDWQVWCGKLAVAAVGCGAASCPGSRKRYYASSKFGQVTCEHYR